MFKIKEAERGVKKMGELQATPVKWFWYPYIAFGKVTVLYGLPGAGKSMFSAMLTAACTNRKTFVGMAELVPGNVLYLTADDDLTDLLYPRLSGAGADMDRVYAIHDLLPITLGDESLEKLAETYRIRLLVIDPIQEYLEHDLYQDAPDLLYPVFCKLENLAKTTGCAVFLTAYSDGGSKEHSQFWTTSFAEKISSILSIHTQAENLQERCVVQERCLLAQEGEPTVFSF